MEFNSPKRSRELMGFNSSANSFAGLVVLFMTIGLGVAIQRIKDHDDPGWAVALGFRRRWRSGC